MKIIDKELESIAKKLMKGTKTPPKKEKSDEQPILWDG